MKNLERVALSSQLSLQWALQVRTNNIANQNTSGFKTDRPLFSKYISPEAKVKHSPSEDVIFTKARGSMTNFIPGNLEETGNSLHLAIEGEGFFAVEQNGETFYTRNGTFTLNDRGELVTQDGNLLLSNGNGGIEIGVNETDINVSADGLVTTDLGPKGTIRIVDFEDKAQLEKVGNLMFKTDADPIELQQPSIRQGFQELANVNAIHELVSLIEISRKYTSTAKMMSDLHDLQSRASRTLSGNSS